MQRRGGACLNRTGMMFTRLRRELFADPNGAAAMIRRLFLEHGPPHWRSYTLSLGFMAVGAVCTAASANGLTAIGNAAVFGLSLAGRLLM